MEDDISPVLALKKEAPNEKTAEYSTPPKATISGAGRVTPSSSRYSKIKRKGNGEDSKTPNGAPLKKVKTEHVSVLLSVLLNASVTVQAT